MFPVISTQVIIYRFFSIASFLRQRGNVVDAVDAGALNYTWKEFGDLIFRGDYDLIVLVNDFDVVEGIGRAADYARALAPAATILTVGRLSYQNPTFFRQFDLDAVGVEGDYEATVSETIRWVANGRPERADVAGVAVRTRFGWRDPAKSGAWLQAAEWVLPDVRDIPYLHYENLYRDDRNKFCGIPHRRELVVPVARGCPVGCGFCDVPAMQGLRERRISVEGTVGYIRDCFATHPFEYVAFYAPTFTLAKRWVGELCDALISESRRYPWKCTTTMHHLNRDLVERMAAAGCVRISVGVETFEPEAARRLPLSKQSPRERFETVSKWCRETRIELNCFVIVGLPGSTAEGTRQTVAAIASAGARARPTLYTPYHRMYGAMSEREVSSFNRQVMAPWHDIEIGGQSPEDLYEF